MQSIMRKTNVKNYTNMADNLFRRISINIQPSMFDINTLLDNQLAGAGGNKLKANSAQLTCIGAWAELSNE